MTRIVVGVDGSDGSRQALAWAVGEAQRRGASVHAVAAWTFPPLIGTLPLSPSYEDFRDGAEEALDAVLRSVPSAVPVTRRVVPGNPASVLAAEPTTGDVLVVGRRGLGGFERLLLGSVSRRVLRRTHVPTVVVPGAPHDGAGVVVGLDGHGDRSLLAIAIEEARRRGTGCTAIHAVDSGFLGATLVAAEAFDALIDAGRELVATAITEVPAGDVKVVGDARLGSAGYVLVEAARDAELLVLGRRGHGILGSVADTCAAHADCPVLIVPDR